MSKKDNKNSKKKFEARIITLGDSAVGKTSLILRYSDNYFSSLYLSTAGIDSKIKIIKLENGEDIRVVLTDTAGQERYRNIASNYIKKADGILLVYDITDKDTFEGVKVWIKSIKEESGDSRPIILLGNKSDLNDKRMIKKEVGEDFAENEGIKFYETSCKTGENVEKAINDLVKQIYEKSHSNPNGKDNNNFQITGDNNKENRRTNCC